MQEVLNNKLNEITVKDTSIIISKFVGIIFFNKRVVLLLVKLKFVFCEKRIKQSNICWSISIRNAVQNRFNRYQI